MKQIFIDQLGRKTSIDFPPQRIISLVPSQTELLAYLGLDEATVGITKFCVHPESWFRNKERIGGTKQLKLDKIEALQPSLIIGNKEENDKEQIEALAAKHPVWLSDVKNLEDALNMILHIGTITNRIPVARQLADQIRKRFDRLAQDLTGKRRRRVAYFIWRAPYYVAAGDTFIDDMLQRAGFENIFGHKSRYPEVSLEELADASPEAILLSSEPYPFKEQHLAPFRQACPITTLKFVDGERFSWYGNRLLHAPDYFREVRQSLMDAYRTL